MSPQRHGESRQRLEQTLVDSTKRPVGKQRDRVTRFGPGRELRHDVIDAASCHGLAPRVTDFFRDLIDVESLFSRNIGASEGS